MPTAYAISRGAPLYEGGTHWWLRDTTAYRGSYDDHSRTVVYYVNNGGEVSYVAPHCGTIGVRPAMWLNLDFKE